MFRVIQWLILYPNAFLLNLNQALSLKGYWAHTIAVIHVPVVEEAIRIHSKHESIVAVKVTWRLKMFLRFRLTNLIINHFYILFYIYVYIFILFLIFSLRKYLCMNLNILLLVLVFLLQLLLHLGFLPQDQGQ